MTVPHLMNCPHRDDGWCLDCVVELGNENWRLREQLAAEGRRACGNALDCIHQPLCGQAEACKRPDLGLVA